MNRNRKRLFVVLLLSAITLVAFGSSFFTFQKNKKKQEANAGYTVVTSFYPMYIATLNVVDGVEGVTIENLSEPETGCLHDFQLSPEDMRLLSKADIFIVNGGGIEEFLKDVASDYPDLQVLETIPEVEEHETNAHVWMCVDQYMHQVEVITEALMQADPSHKEQYQKNGTAYLKKLEVLQEKEIELREKTEGQEVILFHEAYEYLAEELGMEVVGVMDLDEQRQVSAKEVAQVLEEIEEHQVSVVFAEELYGKEMGDVVEAQSDATTIYLDTLVRGEYNKDSYLMRMNENLDKIAEVNERKP